MTDTNTPSLANSASGENASLGGHQLQQMLAEDTLSPVDQDGLVRIANLRDMGGLPTTDGRQVRRGYLYRSALLDASDPVLMAKTRALGIRLMIDLRANGERSAEPAPWQELGGCDYWCRDHDKDGGDLLRLIKENPISGERKLREEMFSLYRVLPFAQRESYCATLQAIIDGRTPLLFHCATGKDRTGVLAALILASLDVPMQLIIEDYSRTNRFDLEAAWQKRGVNQGLPRSVLRPLVAADPAYIMAMFEDIAARHGSVGTYMSNVLQFGHDQQRKLRDFLTEQVK